MNKFTCKTKLKQLENKPFPQHRERILFLLDRIIIAFLEKIGMMKTILEYHL